MMCELLNFSWNEEHKYIIVYFFIPLYLLF